MTTPRLHLNPRAYRVDVRTPYLPRALSFDSTCAGVDLTAQDMNGYLEHHTRAMKPGQLVVGRDQNTGEIRRLVLNTVGIL